MSEVPYKQRTEKSLEWVIGLESIIIGIICGYYANNSGAQPALSVGIGIGALILIYALVVNVQPIFWIWTLALAGVAGFYVHKMLIETDTRADWSLFWAGVSALTVIGIHTKSRSHIKAPTFTNVKNR